MIDIKEKRPQDDEDVIIEDDCWIGMGAIILKGVTIGTGSIFVAGSIVTKSIPPYSIMRTSKTDTIIPRFTEMELRCHQQLLQSNQTTNTNEHE